MAAPRQALRRRAESLEMDDDEAFFRHGFAILQLDGANAHISYYQEKDPDQPWFEKDI